MEQSPSQPSQSTHASQPRKIKIIDSLWTFLIATACLGPLALPLLWRNPRYKTSTKVAGSVLVLVFTAALIIFAKRTLDPLLEEASSLLNN